MEKYLSFPAKSSARVRRAGRRLPSFRGRRALDHPQWVPMALFARWCDHDVWEDMHQHFADDPDMENVLLDSTVVLAHP